MDFDIHGEGVRIEVLRRLAEQAMTDLDFRAIATWFTYLILLLVGRGDLEPDVDAQRELLRTFVVPAFAPAAAKPPVRAVR